MKIDFYIPTDETIPTQLRVKVDDQYDVYYRRLVGILGYEFTFFKCQGITKEMATAITDDIVSQMIDQSYYHGSQWREDKVRTIDENGYKIVIKVYFRVRDAG